MLGRPLGMHAGGTRTAEGVAPEARREVTPLTTARKVLDVVEEDLSRLGVQGWSRRAMGRDE